MVVELPQGYYRDNFIELVDYVHSQYADLLSEQELAFHHHYHRCDEAAQKLLVRMLTRKGHWFRRSKLTYQEIPDTAEAARQLQSHGLIEITQNPDIQDILGLFNKAEWLAALKQSGIDVSRYKSLKRNELDEAIMQLAQQGPLLQHLHDEIYHLTCQIHFDTYKLLFFGNLNQDLTEFVLRDLGLYRFEQYTIDKSARLYSARTQIEQHLEYYRLTADMEQVLAGHAEQMVALHQSLPTATADDKTLNRRVQRANLTLARQLERLECFDEALAIYGLCELPPARERQARILVKQQRIDEGLALCRAMYKNPRNDEEAVVGSEFGYRTAKKHKIDWPIPTKPKPPEQTVTLKRSGQGVELDVAQHLSQFGRCFYVENGLFCSIFGLHYWQVLFAQVPGAFTNPFQYQSHDLYESEFISSRQTLFDQAQSALLNINDKPQHYIEKWQQKFGIATPFVYWEVLSEELIKLALERIEQSHWQAIFQRMWWDIRANRSGFPDLILFKDDGSYELVEVKGPGDKLQKNQLRWMACFEEHQIPYKVMYVEYD